MFIRTFMLEKIDETSLLDCMDPSELWKEVNDCDGIGVYVGMGIGEDAGWKEAAEACMGAG